jgi:hypothetical protein
MYKCLLLKHIWKDQDKKQEGVVLLKSIALDFVPFEGLNIDGGDTYASIGKVESVTYSLGSNSIFPDSGFRLDVADIAPWWSELYGRQLSYEDLVKIYKEDGWKEYEEMFSSQKERNYAAN